MINDHFNMLSSPVRLNWDVFLSFRGDDTRHSFIHSLYDSLTKHGIRVFRDDVGMSQGDGTAPTLLEAIEDSAAYVIVISRMYADSHRSLEELSRICELKRLMLPVFYEVDPSHVRRQKGPFEDDFTSHVDRFGEDEVKKWRKAMEKVGGISGLVFNSSNEDQLTRTLVKRVLAELKRRVGLPTRTVGLDSRTEILMKSLNVKSKGIQILVLHGMGGIGKTTLAKALYNKLINHFELRCFISSVKEIAEEDGGLVSLQNKLLSCLFPTEPPVSEINAGISVIRRKLYEKRVLVVLDDVDGLNQLRVVAGSRDWFSEGSRIIITTRNKEVLVGDVVNEVYEVGELSEPEALQLFSHHALRREKPTDDYLNLSKQLVSLTGKLPLALEVFGSFLLHKRTLTEWEDALRTLQQIRPHDLQAVLRISFDGLDKVLQSVFLDIACLFVKIEMKREEAIDILKGCGFLAETALNVLTAKSLVKIKEDGTLWMHDQLRDMGRQIVLLENLADPGTHSRLWDYNKIMTILRQKKGTGYVQGIILDFRKKKFVEEDRRVDRIFCNSFLAAFGLASAIAYLKEKWMRLLCFLQETEKELEGILDTKSFESMVNLRLLQINHAKLQGKFNFFPATVKWLQWKKCPLKNLPSDYDPSQLAVLDLSESGIEKLWSWRSNKVPEKLIVMNLRHCYNLAAIPDLSGCRTLEKLDLERCRRLTKIDKSLGNLRTLQRLNLQECADLVEFPSDVSGLKCLQNLNLSGCSKLKELPEDIGSMNSLIELLVDRTAISKLPESIYRLSKLEKLSMNGCQLIERLPDCLGNLNSLKELSLNRTTLQELPDSVGSLSDLEKLSLMWCELLARIPESIGRLQSLIELFDNHTAIEEFPGSIGLLSYLKTLSAEGCRSLRKLPNTIDGLDSISELQLNGSSIPYLPDQIGSLKSVEILYLMNCASITTLPESFGSMSSLTTLNLFGSSIIELPESIGMLENLVMLNLNQCGKLQKIPDWKFEVFAPFADGENCHNRTSREFREAF